MQVKQLMRVNLQCTLHLKAKSPLLIACDVYRPAAIDQLKVVGESVGVEVYTEEDVKDL